MGEFEYIDWLRRQTPADPRVLLGPGDASRFKRSLATRSLRPEKTNRESWLIVR